MAKSTDMSAVVAIKKKHASARARSKDPTKNKNAKLKITPDHMLVKDFYWQMRFSNMDIEPEQAAIQCGVSPSAVQEWWDDKEIEKWFHTAPLKFKVAIKIATSAAIRKGLELLDSPDLSIQEKAMRYFIDQSQGKAKDKMPGMDNSEEEEEENMGALLKQLEKLEEKKDGNTGPRSKNKKDQGKAKKDKASD